MRKATKEEAIKHLTNAIKLELEETYPINDIKDEGYHLLHKNEDDLFRIYASCVEAKDGKVTICRRIPSILVLINENDDIKEYFLMSDLSEMTKILLQFYEEQDWDTDIVAVNTSFGIDANHSLNVLDPENPEDQKEFSWIRIQLEDYYS